MRHSRWGLLALVVLTVGLAGLALAVSASAAPGQTQTFHFNTVTDQTGAPTAPTTNVSNCLPAVINDYTLINATGNGISHQMFNANGFWATSTFTGNATVDFYPNGSVDSNGNVFVSGDPEMEVTGHLTDWFGVSDNKQNLVLHGTANFQGTEVFPDPGTPISFHNVMHGAWLPGIDQNGPPSFFFNVASC